MRHLIHVIFPYALIVSVFLLGCQQDKKPTTNGENPVKKDSRVEPAKVDAKQEALEKIEAYYLALEQEDPQAADFFAPVVQRFFGGKNLTRAEISQSITRGYTQVENRRLQVDPQSITVQSVEDGYEVTFQGMAQSTNSQTGEQTQSPFHNQVVFSQEWLIVSYLPVETQSRGLGARQAGDRNGLMQAATRTLDAFRQGDMAAIEDLIHPQWGYFLIYSPGAMNMPQRYETLAAMVQDLPWMGEGNAALDANPTEAALPSFSCDDEFSKQGCFVQRLSGPYQEISTLQEQLLRVDLIGPEQVDAPFSQKFEALISAQLVDTDAYLAFYFGEIDGQWYLLVVDPATYDCSA